MKASAVKYTVLTWVSSLTILVILLMPFHAFLTVWGSTLLGHYTALRLWKEVLLLITGIAVLFLLATDHKIRTHTLTRRLVWLIAAYAAVNFLWGLVAFHDRGVNAKALAYGLLIDLRFLTFFLITWAVSLRMARMRTYWQWIVLWPAFFVVLFGLLQVFILPKDALSHVGYGSSTIPAFETINHNPHYVRIASTLRGANPLGAYLIIPISMLGVLLLQRKIQRKQLALLACALLCLVFSFSRSAWLGVLVSIIVISLLALKTNRARKIVGYTGLGLLILGGISFAALHNNDHFENVVFHTQAESKVKTSSNHGHAAALKNGVTDIAHHPFGHGPGAAGPASVYNNHNPRIAENYFLQVGQETGLIGLLLFLLINIGIGYLLWIRREDRLALSLFASLIGLTVVNLLAHAWADDTLAYVWWGLAGIAMAPDLMEARAASSDTVRQDESK